jgi:DNA-directed RNA polymerase specialized sigma24 family protein
MMVIQRMDSPLDAALNHPDYERTLALAVAHADITIRKYAWRGLRPTFRSDQEILAGDKSASDFVQEAIKRLRGGQRTFDPSRTLLENINSITDSLIWSEKKSSDRSGLIDYGETKDEEGFSSDPISQATGSFAAPGENLVLDELRQDQRRCFEELCASFNGDDEITRYLDALANGFFKPADIQELTGIAVSRIYELRRKLITYAPRFFGVENYRKLARLLNEGESK